jgi:rod shape-determining protein MreD
MTGIILRNTIRFILLVLLQVLVFNNIEFFSFMTPQVYVLFILLLPFETPKWLLLILAFLLGLFVDMFNQTIGLHTAACTLIGFARPWVQNLSSSKQEYEPGIQPGIQGLGFRWFITYSMILISMHHLVIFFLEKFSFVHVLTTLFHTVVNVILTTAAVLLAQVLFYRIKK